jgi:hypothetical protein
MPCLDRLALDDVRVRVARDSASDVVVDQQELVDPVRRGSPCSGIAAAHGAEDRSRGSPCQADADVGELSSDGVYGTLHSLQRWRTSRCASTAMSELATRNGLTPCR